MSIASFGIAFGVALAFTHGSDGIKHTRGSAGEISCSAARRVVISSISGTL